jgi:hypothetical protein
MFSLTRSCAERLLVMLGCMQMMPMSCFRMMSGLLVGAGLVVLCGFAITWLLVRDDVLLSGGARAFPALSFRWCVPLTPNKTLA